MSEPMFDTHAHILSPDREAYPPSEAGRNNRSYPYSIEELIDDMAASGVSRASVVQRYHFYGTDNSYAIDGAARKPGSLTPVIMLDGPDPTAPDTLRRLCAEHPIGGLRLSQPTHLQWDTGWFMGRQAMTLWETAAELGLPVAIIFLMNQLPYTIPALGFVAERFPETPIVIDHMGAPHGPVAYLHVLGEGRAAPHPGAPDFGITHPLRELRRLKNVHFKLSGINLEFLAHHGVDPQQFVRAFADEFGAGRMMCGTDIGQTEGPYGRLVGELRDSLALLDEAERRAVLFDTANRIYGPRLAAA